MTWSQTQDQVKSAFESAIELLYPTEQTLVDVVWAYEEEPFSEVFVHLDRSSTTEQSVPRITKTLLGNGNYQRTLEQTVQFNLEVRVETINHTRFRFAADLAQRLSLALRTKTVSDFLRCAEPMIGMVGQITPIRPLKADVDDRINSIYVFEVPLRTTHTLVDPTEVSTIESLQVSGATTDPIESIQVNVP